MKRFFFVLALIFSSISVFAENIKYSEYFLKGRDFESKKMWVSALGAYWDAMEAEPTKKAKDAYVSYKKIADEIEKGNPGIGSYDEFDFHDEWKKLQSDYEQYWSENPARDFEFSAINRKSRNFENRTVNYFVELKSTLNEKFIEITNIVRTGYEKSWQSDWKMKKDWLYIENEIASNLENASKLKEQLFRKFERENERNRSSKISHTYQQIIFDESLYSISFDVNDTDGTVIMSGVCDCEKTCDFSNVEQLKMKIIDSQKISITPKKVRILGVKTFDYSNINIKTPYTARTQTDENIVEKIKEIIEGGKN